MQDTDINYVHYIDYAVSLKYLETGVGLCSSTGQQIQ